MDKKLFEYLNGDAACHTIPFYWQHGKEHRTVEIEEKMRQIHEDGVRSVCVESRPHPDFAGDEWWRDMDVLFECAEKYGMQVWMLDDDHYPTGHANGGIKKHPELRAWHLAENHADVIGPVSDGMLLLDKFTPEDRVLGVYAYRRAEICEDFLEDAAIDLTDKVKGGFIYLDLPEGAWRVFTLLVTRKSVLDSYIDMLNPASVRVLIDEVYEPHYEHCKKYVGKTFMGFFSDEPRYKNRAIGALKQHTGYYNMNIGVAGMALPWSDELIVNMEKHMGKDTISLLPALWYQIKGKTGDIRYAYMNTLTELYSKYFSIQLGDYCRERGLQYIGHIVEDMGAHARVGNGPGHYFRALSGQDMSGMDLVLSQVLPGFAHFDNKMLGGVGYADSTFFHYILAQMCASLAKINPRMQGRAMCECFGAYGWAESVPMMKWTVDFLLVRGINYFVPHAYDDMFPDADCPPQFGADGHDPQTEGFRRLISYTDRMADLLSGGVSVVHTAILYHAEAEWMNPDGYMSMMQPAKQLLDCHICYDILPIDALRNAEASNGRLCVGEGEYKLLLVPYAKKYPKELACLLEKLQEKGVCVCFVGGYPDGMEKIGDNISLSRIAEYCKSHGAADISVANEAPLLRFRHIKRDGADIYFLFNESVSGRVKTNIAFPVCGECVRISDAEERVEYECSESGELCVCLEPYQSEIIVFNGGHFEKGSKHIADYTKENILNLTYDISLASCESLCEYKFFARTQKLESINRIDGLEGFSGKIKYNARLTLERTDIILDLGDVGHTAELWINGKQNGIRICKPYRFDISNVARIGDNTLEIIVSNTLVHAYKDRHSTAALIGATGLLGPVRILSLQK